MPRVGDLIGTSLMIGTDSIFDSTGAVDGSIKTDTIIEKTAAAGVTIDGVLLKDSAVNSNTINEKTAAAGVTVDGVLLKDASVRIATIQVVGAQGAAVADAAAATAAALTDSSAGVAAQTIVTSAGANPTQAEFNNNMASLTDEINKHTIDIASIRTQLNLILARARAHGLIA